LTTKILLNFKMPNDLGIKISTITAFLNNKLTPEQCKEWQKIMNLDPKLYKKYSFIEVNLNPVENEFEPYSK